MIKILILIILFNISNTLYANNLLKITTHTTKTSQNIVFTFAEKASEPTVFVIANDLIIDIKNTTTNLNNVELDKGLVHTIHTATENGKLRLVIKDASKYKYTTASIKNTLVLAMNEPVGQMSNSSLRASVVNFDAENVATIKVNNIGFSRDDNAAGIISIAYTGDVKIGVEKNRIGDNLSVILHTNNYNSSIIRELDVTDFDTPIKYIKTTSENNEIKLSITNRNNWDYAIYQLQNKLVISIRYVEKNMNLDTIPSLKPSSMSDRVSFNFQNIDVRALLQMLADFSGYNILVSDTVTGTMSIKLNNVPWDQALNTILIAKGLAMKRTENVIRIAPAGELAAISKQQQDSQKSFEAVEPLEAMTIRLKYAQADSIQLMILKPATINLAQCNVSNGANCNQTEILSPRGSILTDTRTNTIIINDTPSKLKTLKELIDKIDVPVKQVLIEARIVEATSNFEKDLGVRLLLAGVGNKFTVANSLDNGININQTGINSISGGAATAGDSGATNTGFVNQEFGIQGGASLATIFTPNSDLLLGLEIDALELQSQGRTISSPKVMTANYQSANIQQGIQIPYQQASSAGNTNIAFVSATLSLQVTPQITDDGYILLNINLKKDTPNTSLVVQGTPSINTHSIMTQVRVKDGSTISIGGIYVDDQQQIHQQVPWLGDIPYIGWMFKAQSTINSKKELLVFITPRIIINGLEDAIN